MYDSIFTSEELRSFSSKSDYWIKEIKQNRGRPRIYLDGPQAIRARLSPGEKLLVRIGEDHIVLTVNRDGSRTIERDVTPKGPYQERVVTVSKRVVQGKTLPVLDLNSDALLSIFRGMNAVRVIVTEASVHFLPLASEVNKRDRLRRLKNALQHEESLAMASVSHGVGVLSAAIHAGLARAGIKTHLAFANEIREDLLAHARKVNPAWDTNTMAIAAPMQELAQDQFLLSLLPKVHGMELGLPCSGASSSGVAKLGLSKMEDHPHVGHLVGAAMTLVQTFQPGFILFENVTNYAKSASCQIIRGMLRDMGYDLHEATLSGKDFGVMEHRVRWCMVAVTQGIDFSWDDIAPKQIPSRRVSDFLENVAEDDPRWSKMEGLKRKQVRDKLNGKGFMMQIVTPYSEAVPTITKGYKKNRSTDPKLQHPTDPDLLRLFTPIEHGRLKGLPGMLPERFAEGVSETVAHEMLGQSVAYDPFEHAGHRIGESLQQLDEAQEMGDTLGKQVGSWLSQIFKQDAPPILATPEDVQEIVEGLGIILDECRSESRRQLVEFAHARITEGEKRFIKEGLGNLADWDLQEAGPMDSLQHVLQRYINTMNMTHLPGAGFGILDENSLSDIEAIVRKQGFQMEDPHHLLDVSPIEFKRGSAEWQVLSAIHQTYKPSGDNLVFIINALVLASQYQTHADVRNFLAAMPIELQGEIAIVSSIVGKLTSPAHDALWSLAGTVPIDAYMADLIGHDMLSTWQAIRLSEADVESLHEVLRLTMPSAEPTPEATGPAPTECSAQGADLPGSKTSQDRSTALPATSLGVDIQFNLF